MTADRIFTQAYTVYLSKAKIQAVANKNVPG